mgnify:CR=1 FL=1
MVFVYYIIYSIYEFTKHNWDINHPDILDFSKSSFYRYIKDGIFETEKAKKAINLSEDMYELLVIFGNIYNEILSEENRMTMIRKLESCSYFTTLTNDRIHDIFYTNILTN